MPGNLLDKKKSPVDAVYLQPPAVKVLFACVLFVVIFLLGILVLQQRSHSQLRKITMQKAQQEQEVMQQSKTYEELRYYSKNVLDAKKEYDALLKKFPSQAHIDDVLSSITKIGTQDGVKFISFQPQTEVVNGYYAATPVEIVVVGGFHHLAKFLSDIANLSGTAIAVNKFSMSHVEKQDDLLSLKMVATLYYTLPTSMEVKLEVVKPEVKP